jgi:thiosulfate/3-mercaptopyruvate sulfurtransferase
MTNETETAIAAKGYARPDKLVSTEWLAAHLDDPTLRILESDEDVLLYDMGHIPGAQKIDWHVDLNDPVQRDYVSAEAFSELLRSRGIDGATPVILYGDKSNWWAAYAPARRRTRQVGSRGPAAGRRDPAVRAHGIHRSRA